MRSKMKKLKGPGFQPGPFSYLFLSLCLLLQLGTAVDHGIQTGFQELDAFVRRGTVFAADPPLNCGDKGVGEEVDLEVDHLVVVIQDALEIFIKNGVENSTEMVYERVLTVKFQNLSVEVAVFVEIADHGADALPFGEVVPGRDRLVAVDKFGVEDPVHQIVLVTEMIVEAGAVHVAFVTDFSNSDFIIWKLLREFFQRRSKGSFRNDGICH